MKEVAHWLCGWPGWTTNTVVVGGKGGRGSQAPINLWVVTVKFVGATIRKFSEFTDVTVKNNKNMGDTVRNFWNLCVVH